MTHIRAGPADHARTLGEALVALVRARGSFDRMIHGTACRHAAARTQSLLAAQLRAAATSRRFAPGTKQSEPLLDILVHGQDVALALGRERAMPLEPTRVPAQRAWSMGLPPCPSRPAPGCPRCRAGPGLIDSR